MELLLPSPDMDRSKDIMMVDFNSTSSMEIQHKACPSRKLKDRSHIQCISRFSHLCTGLANLSTALRELQVA